MPSADELSRYRRASWLVGVQYTRFLTDGLRCDMILLESYWSARGKGFDLYRYYVIVSCVLPCTSLAYSLPSPSFSPNLHTPPLQNPHPVPEQERPSLPPFPLEHNAAHPVNPSQKKKKGGSQLTHTPHPSHHTIIIPHLHLQRNRSTEEGLRK